MKRAIRLLKGRWRKLQHIDHLNQKLAVLIIIAACVLHSVCLLHDDFDEGYMLDKSMKLMTMSMTMVLLGKITDKPSRKGTL